MKKLGLFVLSLLFLFPSNSNSQIFGRIMDRAADDFSRKVEDKIARKLSEEIAKAAFRPVEKALDDMMQERYEQDTLNGNYDGSYSDFVKMMTISVDLPESYTFDIILEAETEDYDGKERDMDMLLSKDGGIIGFSQEEGESYNFVIFDQERQIMAVYDQEKKTVMALPSMFNYVEKKMEDIEEEITIEKTGKTKKIAGYECDEYKIEDEETNTKAYIAKDFPISWREAYEPFLKQMSPTTRREKMPEGMVLKSEAKTKKKGKKSSFEVEEVREEEFKIINAEYQKQDYSTADYSEDEED